jgi:hypothetical protein
VSGNLEDLDAAFELPDVVEDVRLRALYEVLVSRMRDEARHLPMNTVQMLLIERIATNYIVLKAKERGELGGFTHTSVQKEYNTFWLTMTAEFNRMLGKGEIATGDRKALLKEVQTIIVNTVKATPVDPKAQAALLENLASAFESARI